MIDTHCHLNIMSSKKPEALLTVQNKEEIALVVQRSLQAGIKKMICVGTSIPESINCIDIAASFAQVKATIGVHPCDITEPVDVIVEKLEHLLVTHRSHIVGIGETGLDYYHQPYDKTIQARVFEAQISLAKKYALPLVVHIREAGDDALALLAAHKDSVRGVIHCFSLDQAAAERVIDWGWYIGIDGPVTYPKNHALRALVAAVPLHGLLLETDAPFLPPQALRGKQNCPSNLGIIADEIAKARGISRSEVIAQTTKNAEELFSC